MKDTDIYNSTLEAAGMISPRKAAAILGALPEQILIQLGVIEPHEQHQTTQTDNRRGTCGRDKAKESNRAADHKGRYTNDQGRADPATVDS